MLLHNFLYSILLLSMIISSDEAQFLPKVVLYSNQEGGYLPAIINPNIDYKLFFNFEGLSSVKEKDIHFFLYTKYSDLSEELIIGERLLLKYSYFNRTLPTKIIIHGFTNSDKFGFAPAAREAFLKDRRAPPVNLIVVEWSRLCHAPWYNDAAKNTQLVGIKLARFIEFLVEQGISLDQIHLIGHSLGAHVAGFAGVNMHNKTLSRITALDPALPLFDGVTDDYRIDPSDAAFVDVIHTAGGSFTSSPSERVSLAFMDPRGDADFYVNGGKNQPGCGVDLFGACSHIRAYEYYLESIVSPIGFPSCKCSTWKEYSSGRCACRHVARLGEPSSSSARGMFFLRTGARKPFAILEDEK